MRSNSIEMPIILSFLAKCGVTADWKMALDVYDKVVRGCST